ncbi:tigger transposable element-derived protein 2 [Nephila pilipes]|uniref:Tigger transposable element-derived protein 2 n=1 Tax=Nephila pilipes TaxID=299642 RepID=A0A8X6N4L9_NEPPI|nr:tigger transposable element-derived protein 2 [Nephila pilipes]
MSIYSELEKVPFTWYEQARASNIPLDENIFREKAFEIAATNSMDIFSASNGWISLFKIRHGSVSRKLCGESTAILNAVGLEMWLEKLPNLQEGYKDCDIYNADETGLFHKCLPERTLAFKGESCHSGKFPKKRLTVLLWINKDGFDKRIPLVIGKSSRFRWLKNLKKLLIAYHSNAKSMDEK